MNPSPFAAGLAVLLCVVAPSAYGQAPAIESSGSPAARLATPLDAPMPWARRQAKDPAAWRPFLSSRKQAPVAIASEDASPLQTTVFDGTAEAWQREPGARSEVTFCCDVVSVVDPAPLVWLFTPYDAPPLETLTMR